MKLSHQEAFDKINAEKEKHPEKSYRQIATEMHIEPQIYYSVKSEKAKKEAANTSTEGKQVKKKRKKKILTSTVKYGRELIQAPVEASTPSQGMNRFMARPQGVMMIGSNPPIFIGDVAEIAKIFISAQ